VTQVQHAVMRWPPLEVISIREKLDELGALVEEKQRDTNPGPVPDWLARLLVVRTCGYLEQVVRGVARGFIMDRSGGYVRNFAQTAIPEGRNPAPSYLVEWVGKFDAELADELGELLEADDQRLHRELAFLVDRRNKIAHGLNEGLTARKALDLKSVACEVADWFILKFNPDR
jgi:hypothetical protein